MVFSIYSGATLASKLLDEELHPSKDMGDIVCTLMQKAREHGMSYRTLGDGHRYADWECMIVSQSEPIPGYHRGIDLATIPEFQESAKDKVVRELLDAAGITDYKFVTYLD
ncbi:hypothetical protein H0H92_009112 [Tricholoma furcatifolium]|nr:hypothetical protein H0H92_009112 [Tricholoma furcatifolium]